MFELNSQEESRLKHNAGDPAFMEALRKLFLDEFLKEREESVENLAASRLAIDYLKSALRRLENLKEKKLETPEVRNIV